MEIIVIGFEIGSGESVAIEPNHTFIAGTTGTGKSKAMQRLIKESKGHLLIVDAKRKRDYAGLNADIPLYIKQQMEPIVIKDSIETTERFTIKQQFGTLLDTVAESETWEEMLEVIERELKTQRSGYIKNNLKILRYFIKRLVKEYEKYIWSDKLEMNNGVSVLDISRMSIQMQQLVVGSVVNYIQDNLTDVTVIIDEAHRFIPQGMTSGCSRDIVRFIREGRASDNWMWLADQTVTGISKDLLKQMQYWVLGRQSELNEAQRTVKQIPRAKSLGVNIEEIQTLGLGEFLVVCPEWAKKTYIWPLWIDDDTAKKVALGEMTAKQVARLEKKKVGDDDLVWKRQFEVEQKRRIELEKELKSVKTDDLQKDNARETITTLKEMGSDTAAHLVKANDRVKELESQLANKPADNTELDELRTEHEKMKDAYMKEQRQWVTATEEMNKQNELLLGEIEIQKLGSQAFEKLRELLGSQEVAYTATVKEEVYNRLKTEITREVIAKVGTGTITVTEDIDLGKFYQEQAYEHAVEQVKSLTDEQIKILGWLMHIDKGVTRAELIEGVYHKENLRGQASKKLTDNLVTLKNTRLTTGIGGRIKSNVDIVVTDSLKLSQASDQEIEQILAKVKGFIAKRLRGSNGG